jgi:hypothetical protein
MPRNTPSVPTIVASLITRDLALYECFRRKLVNYHAVAASIKPDVEKLAEKTTTINTIVVAITRFSESIERVTGEKPVRILGGARISLASDVVAVTIRARKTEQYEIAKRIGELAPSLSEPTKMFQLSNSIELVGVKIRQTYIGEETVLIMSRADGPRAFEVLQAEIDESRVASMEGKSKAPRKSSVGTAELLQDELEGTFSSKSIGRD